MAHYKKEVKIKEERKEKTIEELTTPRQREILALLAGGKCPKEIGAILGISARTVEFHKYRLYQRYGVHSVAELAVIFANIAGQRWKEKALNSETTMKETLDLLQRRIGDILSSAPEYRRAVEAIFEEVRGKIPKLFSNAEKKAPQLKDITAPAAA